MRRVLVLNGPNLNLLGVREPGIYGTTTLSELEDQVRRWGTQLGMEVESFQSNHEGELIDRIHDARTRVDGLVINAGALTHYGRGLQEALSAVDLPAVEVHISNIKEREAFRRESLIAATAIHTIYGRGLAGYRWALRHLHHRSAMAFEQVPYGPFPDQFGDLRTPADRGRRLVVLLHGGLWKHEWTRDTIEGIAVDLTSRGYLTWNLEYRRVGTGGGWPESFDDVRSALAAAPAVTGIQAQDTVVLGHSAGGTMALWSGGLGEGLAPHLTVGMAAIPDLVKAEEEHLGQGAIQDLFGRHLFRRDLLGGRRRPDPADYSPVHRLPTGTGTILAITTGDQLVPSSQGLEYSTAAQAAGDLIDLMQLPGRHSSFLGPEDGAWKDVASSLRARISPL